MDHAHTEETIDLRTLYYRILNRKWVVLTVMAVLVTIVAINCALTKPVYRASAQILIEKESSSKEVYKESVGIDVSNQDYYQTQYAILKSRSLARRVIDELNLSENKEFKAKGDTVSAFLKNVYVEPVKNTRIVSLSIESHDPKLSAEMANVLAKLYIRQNLELRGFVSKNVMERISGEVRDGEAKADTLPSVVADPLVSKLRGEYAEQEAELANLSKRYKDKHPKIIGLKASLDTLKQKIDSETQRLLDSLNVELSGALKGSNMRIVDPAEVPKWPVKPRTKLNIILAAIVGFCMGSGLAFLLDYMDATVRTPEELEAISKIPFLGHVPKIKLEELDPSVDCPKEMVAQAQPRSLAAEAFKIIRTGLVFSAPQNSMKVFLVTSPGSQEGKTLTAINIAASLGQTGSRVVLVDADMRRSAIHKPFGLNMANGLSEYLSNGADLDSVIRRTKLENLFVITSGAIPQKNPAELLCMERMRTLIAELKSKFDRVIIDTTPIMVVADALILADMADGVIYVARADFTTKRAARGGIKKFASVKADFAGMVLNDVNLGKHGYYYDNYYYYSGDHAKRKRPRLIKGLERVRELTS